MISASIQQFFFGLLGDSSSGATPFDAVLFGSSLPGHKSCHSRNDSEYLLIDLE